MTSGLITRRRFLGCTGAGALALTGCATRSAEILSRGGGKRRPNIVFVLADDLGYADLGCFGSTLYETPNLDLLAASGIRFTHAYAACPVCSPTRASIMTGKYPARAEKMQAMLKAWRNRVGATMPPPNPEYGKSKT